MASAKIQLNEEQSKILIDIALKDLLPKELERIKKETERLKIEDGIDENHCI